MKLKYASPLLTLLALWGCSAVFHFVPDTVWAEWYGFPLIITTIVVAVVFVLGGAIALDELADRRKSRR